MLDVRDHRKQVDPEPRRALAGPRRRAPREIRADHRSRPRPGEELRVHAGSATDGEGAVTADLVAYPPSASSDLLLQDPSMPRRRPATSSVLPLGRGVLVEGLRLLERGGTGIPARRPGRIGQKRRDAV